MNKLEKLGQDWDDLAHIDPMWAIASDPTKQHGKWQTDEFFATGRKRIQHMFHIANESGITITGGVCLDFGCGAGRFTQALAEHFEECYGVDISPQMIELANRFNRFGDQCKYILNQKNDLEIFPDEHFDFVYTSEVLQHMPPELMEPYLVEFVRVLRRDGILIFEVPTQKLVQDTGSIRLQHLPKVHPKRVWNKLKSILIGHDKATRYHRLRRLGIPKTWLYERLGLRPAINMHYLGENTIRELMGKLEKRVTTVYEKEYEGMTVTTFAVT